MAGAPRRRPRPTPELTAALRAGKAELHRQRAHMRLREKVRIVLELQRICLPLVEHQRRLAPWERPWPVVP